MNRCRNFFLKFRRISGILFIGGMLILGYGFWQLESSHVSEAKAYQSADKLVGHLQPKPSFQRVTAQSFHPKKGEVIGTLDIPSLKKKLPIIQGTDAAQLKRGVGHYITSAFPTENNQIVLSGHRDTVFRKLGKLKKGDAIIVHFPFGSFTYLMVRSEIVAANNRTIIHSTSPKEELVLTTCYPFYYIGDAPKRYIVYAKPVKK